MLSGRLKVETSSSMLGLDRKILVERSTVEYLTSGSLSVSSKQLLDRNAEPKVPPEGPVMVHMLYNVLC